jgi:hypothetical protein
MRFLSSWVERTTSRPPPLGIRWPTFRSLRRGLVIKDRLRQLVRVVGAIAITIAVAAATSAVALYLTGPNGSISCALPAPPAEPDRIPRWVLAAGVPALVTGFVGAFFALGAGRVLWQLVGLVLAVALAAATFYGVYALLPANCRP